jgi:hypothetical protein
MDDNQALRQFLSERPAINLSAFARECGIGRVNFTKILAGLRKIPQSKRGAVLSAMKKYGFLEAQP